MSERVVPLFELYRLKESCSKVNEVIGESRQNVNVNMTYHAPLNQCGIRSKFGKYFRSDKNAVTLFMLRTAA